MKFFAHFSVEWSVLLPKEDQLAHAKTVVNMGFLSGRLLDIKSQNSETKSTLQKPR